MAQTCLGFSDEVHGAEVKSGWVRGTSCWAFVTSVILGFSLTSLKTARAASSFRSTEAQKAAPLGIFIILYVPKGRSVSASGPVTKLASGEVPWGRNWE